MTKSGSWGCDRWWGSAKIISRWIRNPCYPVWLRAGGTKPLSLEDELHKEVIGQDGGRGWQMPFCSQRPESRIQPSPLVLLFLDLLGVGKTELAKTLGATTLLMMNRIWSALIEWIYGEISLYPVWSERLRDMWAIGKAVSWQRAVQKKAVQRLLFDEIEKAPSGRV